MSDSKGCGPHAQIFANDHVRISQCTCGTYHVSFQKKGVTVQLNADEVRALTDGGNIAMRVADAEARGRSLATGNGDSIN